MNTFAKKTSRKVVGINALQQVAIPKKQMSGVKGGTAEIIITQDVIDA